MHSSYVYRHIRTQHCVSALWRQDKKRIMSTFLGLMLLLPAVTTSPALKNTSHELSIVSELWGTKYQYCKYWYRYWWYRYCGIILPISIHYKATRSWRQPFFFTMLGGSSASWCFFVVWLVAFVDISVEANLAVAAWSITSVETDMSLVKAGNFKVLKIEQEMRRKYNKNEPPPMQ